MARLGIHTGAQLRAFSLWKLIEFFGNAGYWYYNCCRGIDERDVEVTHIRKSLGRERTFEKDIGDQKQLSSILKELCAKVWERLEKLELVGRRVIVKVKYYDFKSASKSHSFPSPIENLRDFIHISTKLLSDFQTKRRPLRLIGISISLLTDRSEKTKQLNLNF